MRIKLLSLAIGLTLAAESSLAQSYRAEADLAYNKLSLEDSSTEADGWTVSGTYFFSPVNTTNHPLAEAAFLEKSSNLQLSYNRNESESHESFSSWSYARESTQEIVSADINFFIPNSIFYVSLGISDQENEFQSRYTAGGETETNSYKGKGDSRWNASLGITPLAGLLVWSDFYEDVDLDDYWNLNAKYVMDWSGNALNLQAHYGDSEDGSSLTLATDFYFDRTFSLGVGYTFYNYDDEYYDDGVGFLRGRKFFSDNFSISAQYIKDDYFDEYTIGASLRF